MSLCVCISSILLVSGYYKCCLMPCSHCYRTAVCYPIFISSNKMIMIYDDNEDDDDDIRLNSNTSWLPLSVVLYKHLCVWCRYTIGHRVSAAGRVCERSYSRTRRRVRDQTSSRTISRSITSASRVSAVVLRSSVLLSLAYHRLLRQQQHDITQNTKIL